MKIDIITIFPEYLEPLKMSLIGKAVQRGDIAVAVHDLRAWTHDVHRTVDDSPFGGGPGMVMKPEPWGEALDAVRISAADAAQTRAGGADAVWGAVRPGDGGGVGWLRAAGVRLRRYEGIDERVVENARRRMVVHELSIGDYVLAGRRVGGAGDGRGDLPPDAGSTRQRAIGARRLLRRRARAR